MLKLYQRERCPYCKPVREKLTDLGVTYVNVNVPRERGSRTELIKLTGLPFIPALVDGAVVLPGRLEDCCHILEYLEERYAGGRGESRD
jgi:glutathione S-transferase